VNVSVTPSMIQSIVRRPQVDDGDDEDNDDNEEEEEEEEEGKKRDELNSYVSMMCIY
jgi:hypothetical protein